MKNSIVLSNGVDIVKISRIKNSIENPRFLDYVYGKNELLYCKTLANSLNFLAGNFAAKEAFSKSLGTGVRGFSLNQVEILRDDLGSPYFKFSGEALTIVKKRGLSFSISISHEKEYAVAFVTAFRF